MYLKEQIMKFYDLAQELEEVCTTDGFLEIITEVNKEHDDNDKYNITDVLSFVSDVDDALKNGYESMEGYYEDY